MDDQWNVDQRFVPKWQQMEVIQAMGTEEQKTEEEREEKQAKLSNNGDDEKENESVTAPSKENDRI